MAKLYPPNIEGTIPAFYTHGRTLLKIPFSMNPAVAKDEIAGFALKIKSVNDNSLIYTTRKTFSELGFGNYNLDRNCYVTFNISGLYNNKTIIVGNFYKIQIAYLSLEVSGSTRQIQEGYYSTVGIVKYSHKPRVTIAGLSAKKTNVHQYTYTGEYTQSKIESGNRVFLDVTEKLYSSRFDLLDANNNIVQTSGEILHDTSADENRYRASEYYTISEDLPLDKAYYLKFTTTSINGLVESSPAYRIQQRRRIPMALKINLQTSMDYENGAAIIKMVSEKFQVATGTFLISRASSEDNYVWQNFKYFYLQSEEPDKRIFRDYTVKQGVTYKYSIQQYNSSGIYSERQLSNSLTVDFEDMYLYDGERQLRIRYNPKVASFKKDLAEQKIETIGSKYPFIFRNGKVGYKEFSISGLISYLADENELFMTKSELGINGDDTTVLGNNPTRNLVGYNIAAERTFKMDVLEWLTNGEAKIFRSPSEGNYIVRLMNVSMSPNDVLGRMLHTFTCTAYEIADFSYENLAFYNLLQVNDSVPYVMRWKTVELKNYYSNNSKERDTTVELNDFPAYSIFFVDMVQGAQFGLQEASNADTQWFVIGATGSYKMDFSSPITSIIMKKGDCLQGKLTFGYKGAVATVFDRVTGMSNEDVPCEQYIGGDNTNLVDKINDSRTNVLLYYYIKFLKREQRVAYVDYSEVGTSPSLSLMKENLKNLYTDSDKANAQKVSRDDFKNGDDSLNMYHLKFCQTGKKIDKNGKILYVIKRNGAEEEFDPDTDIVWDCKNDKFYLNSSDLFIGKINGNNISVEDKEEFYTDCKDLDVKSISFERGVICELGYQRQITEYSWEKSGNLKTFKDKWTKLLQDYLNDRDLGILLGEELEKKRLEVIGAYSDYIKELKEVKENYEKETGV